MALKKKTSRPRSVRFVSGRLSGARNGPGAGTRLSSAATPAKKAPREIRLNQVEGTGGQGDTGKQIQGASWQVGTVTRVEPKTLADRFCTEA